MKHPFIQQHDEKDCGAACLSMICEFYGSKLTLAHLRELIKVDNQGANIYGIVNAANVVGIDASALVGSFDELYKGIKNGDICFPFIARIVNEHMYEHFVVVYGEKKDKLIIGDPAKSRIKLIPIEHFKSCWLGNVITFEKTEDFTPINERKKALLKYFKFITSQKKVLVLLMVVSIIITGINLASSTVFQYVLQDSVGSADVAVQSGEEIEIHEHDHEHEQSSVGRILSIISPNLENDFNDIDKVCIAIIIMYLMRTCLQMLRGYILAITSKRVDVPLTMSYYKHLMKLPFEFYGSRKTGELMSRFADTEKIRNAISSATLTIMLDSVMAIGCGGMLCYINRKLFFITLIIVSLYFAITIIFKKSIRSINHQIMESDAEVTSYLKESIDGIETIKAYQLEDSCIEKTSRIYNILARKYVKGTTIYSCQSSLINLLHSVGIILILWIGTHLCCNRAIQFVDLLTFYYLIDMFIMPLERLINLQPQLQTAIAAAERLDDIMNAELEKDSDVDNSVWKFETIELKNIEFGYGNRESIIKDININIPKGKKIAIIGESGCGKTTIAKLLLSFYEPRNGEITIDGKNVNSMPKSLMRKHIAYISQNTFMFSDSVLNNIIMNDDSILLDEMKNICSQCRVDSFVNKLPLGYNSNLEENGGNLSGGQKQRLAIARALIRKPDVLIMDEATSNLDIVTEKEILNYVDEVDENLTCVIIAHRLDTIRNCDYVYVMNDGRIVESGTPADIIKSFFTDGDFAQ